LAWISACAIAVAVVLYAFFMDVWRVPVDDPLLGASLEPTLRAGDLVVFMRRSTVTRGILLRCLDPDAPGRFVVARSVARSGEHVEIRNEVVMVDSRRLGESHSCGEPLATVYDPRSSAAVSLSCQSESYGDLSFETLRSSDQPEPPTEATVGASQWYLVSDNRHIHLDSRDYGTIDPGTCQHVVFRLTGDSSRGDRGRGFGLIW